MVFRFAGFELDEQRAELRGPDGAAIKLRPKTFEMLRLLAAHAGRVLTKRELMEAVWPNVHVGEDGLFQCIREIRAALGDERREMVKLVSGRGYLFALEVSSEPAVAARLGTETEEMSVPRGKPGWLSVGQRASAVLAVAGFAVVVGLAAIASAFGPDLVPKVTPPTIAILPIVDASQDGQGVAMAAGVTNSLIDGLAQISSFRVVSPPTDVATAGSNPDLLVRGELVRAPDSWTLQLRTIKGATGEVQSVTTATVDSDEPDVRLLQARLAAGAGDPLARRLNMLFEAGEATGTGDVGGSTAAKVAIEQASASINQTSRERFGVAQSMLEEALAAEPNNVDVQVALAALQLRGVQMVWYGPEDKAAAEADARTLLKRALDTHPNYIPVLEAHCRLLSATNQFAESLVACGRALSFDPWDGSALYLTGLGQIFLGRFEDALASFKLADRYDTPVVGRWTWKLGIGWTYVLTGHNEEALPWLEQSIAITPASGRSYLQLAIAYQRLGRTDEAKAAFAKAMELRPGSTALNVMPPTENVSPRFLELAEKAIREMIELGLPES
jgi:DNA-binding winged helix-turn-helix (wHTH) protein/tetratricopeptide (TPR) repeat protein